jgi:hypothetical protein
MVLEVSRVLKRYSILFLSAATGKCTGQVADYDNVVNCADDAVGDLEAFEVLEFEELVVDLAHDNCFNLLAVNVDDNIVNFTNKHSLVSIDLQAEQFCNVGFHRYQMKVYT